MVPEGCRTAWLWQQLSSASPGAGRTTAVPVGPNIWQKEEASQTLACRQQPANSVADYSLSKGFSVKKKNQTKEGSNTLSSQASGMFLIYGSTGGIQGTPLV